MNQSEIHERLYNKLLDKYPHKLNAEQIQKMKDVKSFQPPLFPTALSTEFTRDTLICINVHSEKSHEDVLLHAISTGALHVSADDITPKMYNYAPHAFEDQSLRFSIKEVTNLTKDEIEKFDISKFIDDDYMYIFRKVGYWRPKVTQKEIIDLYRKFLNETNAPTRIRDSYVISQNLDLLNRNIHADTFNRIELGIEWANAGSEYYKIIPCKHVKNTLECTKCNERRMGNILRDGIYRRDGREVNNEIWMNFACHLMNNKFNFEQFFDRNYGVHITNMLKPSNVYSKSDWSKLTNKQKKNQIMLFRHSKAYELCKKHDFKIPNFQFMIDETVKDNVEVKKIDYSVESADPFDDFGGDPNDDPDSGPDNNSDDNSDYNSDNNSDYNVNNDLDDKSDGAPDNNANDTDADAASASIKTSYCKHTPPAQRMCTFEIMSPAHESPDITMKFDKKVADEYEKNKESYKPNIKFTCAPNCVGTLHKNANPTSYDIYSHIYFDFKNNPETYFDKSARDGCLRYAMLSWSPNLLGARKIDIECIKYCIARDDSKSNTIILLESQHITIEDKINLFISFIARFGKRVDAVDTKHIQCVVNALYSTNQIHMDSIALLLWRQFA